jgi:hypothetical protein
MTAPNMEVMMFPSFEKNAAYRKIYHRKWNTEENEVYNQQIYTVCGIDNSKIPVSWSREIYELIRTVQGEYPGIKILNVKEKQYELKFYFTLPTRYPIQPTDTRILNQLLLTKGMLILKNAYLYSAAQIKSADSRIESSELAGLQQALAGFTPEEIADFQSREPEFRDELLLEETLPRAEIDDACAYLDAHLPGWREKLYFEQKKPENHKNPRIEIILHLAARFSGFRQVSISSSDEILSLDKFSQERTRAIFGEDIALQLSLKFYEKGDREGLEQLKDGQLTAIMKAQESELIQNKEKSILVENIVAFYKLKEKEAFFTNPR